MKTGFLQEKRDEKEQVSWKGNAELLKSLRVGWEKSVQSVEAHMAAS